MTGSSRRLLPFCRDIAAVCVVSAYVLPLLWWVYLSVEPYFDVFNKDGGGLLSFTPTLDNYRFAFSAEGPDAFNILEAMKNSVIIASGSTVLAVSCGLAAAFALSRFDFRRRNTLTLSVLAFRFLPAIAVIIPAAIVMRQINAFDTRLSIIVMHAAMNLPLAILMLKSFFDEVPREVDDAARIDGASQFQVFTQIVLPIARGGIAATAIFCFIFSYIEFLMALFLSVSFRTVPVTMAILVAGASWGTVAAAGLSSMLPGFIFILLVQRYIVRGLTLGIHR
jgi:multiple sugar transport system permease protein